MKRSTLCGTFPSRPSSLESYNSWDDDESDFEGIHLIPGWDVWCRSQPVYGCCAGQACVASAEIQSQTSEKWSGVSLWRAARALQGRIEKIDEGTRFEYVISALHSRGYSDPYREGEDYDDREAGLGAPKAGDDLLDELQAYKTKRQVRRHWVICPSASAWKKVLSCVCHGLPVPIAFGIRNPFLKLGFSEEVTSEHLGATTNGHAMLVIGAQESYGKLRFLVKNSWGEKWGGASVLGQKKAGLFWLPSDLISYMWEAHPFEI